VGGRVPKCEPTAGHDTTDLVSTARPGCANTAPCLTLVAEARLCRVPPPLLFDPLMPQAVFAARVVLCVEGARMTCVNAAQAATWAAVSAHAALGSALTNITRASLG
jgi:hypothetical protein